jgi:hypothetical protein
MGIENITANDLCLGVYSLNTRRFGTVAEILIKKLLQVDWGIDQFHDLYDKEKNKRIEVKFSRALKSNELTISSDNIIESIVEASGLKRMIASTETDQYLFDCNIQQIKKSEFDILYYGIFYSDLVEIFRIESNKIDSSIFYSDKQHKGNIGEGQFHINNQSINIHRSKFHYQSIKYDDIIKIFLRK